MKLKGIWQFLHRIWATTRRLTANRRVIVEDGDMIPLMSSLGQVSNLYSVANQRAAYPADTRRSTERGWSQRPLPTRINNDDQ